MKLRWSVVVFGGAILVSAAPGQASGPDAAAPSTRLNTASDQPCVTPAQPKRRPRSKAGAATLPKQEGQGCPPPAPVIGPGIPELQMQLDSQRDEIEALKQGLAEPPPPPSPPPAPVSALRFSSFGEAHYAHLRERNPDRVVEQFNVDRIVVGLGYSYSPSIRLITALELEDGTSFENDNVQNDEDGDLHIEAAYAEFDLPRRQGVRAGVFPLPLGILNQRHLPIDYYGVERPVVEQEILPTTWSELGVGLFGQMTDQLSYDLALHSGLLTPGSGEPNAFRARDGLQRSSLAEGSGIASTARLKYLLTPVVELAGAVHHEEDIRQGLDPGETQAWLYETHALAQFGRLGLRGLWARWDVDGLAAEQRGRDTQDGYYLESSWRFNPRWGAFLQWSEWDTGNASGDAGEKRIMSGFNYWPIPNLVFKFDFKHQDGEDGSENYGGRFGFGYAF